MSQLLLASLLSGSAHAEPSPHPAAGEPHGTAEAASHGVATTAHEGAEAAAAGGGHHGPNMPVLAMQTGALVLFLAILVKVASRPIGDALKTRAASVREQLEEAKRLKAEADARAAEVERRLAALDTQVAEMKAQAQADAAAESARIAARAEADAARLRETAERTLREETTRARNELRAEAVQLAVELARGTLARGVNAEDQQRLAREFLAVVNTNGEA
jgi:F-type H+-transporting ATPase subunit b